MKNNKLIFGIFAGVITSILGNLLITSFFEGFRPATTSIAQGIFYTSAVLFILFMLFLWIKPK